VVVVPGLLIPVVEDGEAKTSEVRAAGIRCGVRGVRGVWAVEFGFRDGVSG
jgi:hypothetical protein